MTIEYTYAIRSLNHPDRYASKADKCEFEYGHIRHAETFNTKGEAYKFLDYMSECSGCALTVEVVEITTVQFTDNN